MYLRSINHFSLSLASAPFLQYTASNSQTNIQPQNAKRILSLQTEFDKNNQTERETFRPTMTQRAVFLPNPITKPNRPAPKRVATQLSVVATRPLPTPPIIVNSPTKVSATRSTVSPVRPILTPVQTRIAKVTGMDRLYSQGSVGQGQKVAVIEFSGTWDKMHNFVRGSEGVLPTEIRQSYAKRFLPPLPLPGGVDPNKHFEGCLDASYHGSCMASTILDFSPQAHVLPISTYRDEETGHFYSSDAALMDLSKRADIKVINIASGFFDYRVEEYIEGGILKHIYSFSEESVSGIKAAAAAGKIIVMAAGNEGEPIPSLPSSSGAGPEIANFAFRIRGLFSKLDKQTMKSIILAGNINFYSDRWMKDLDSNYPGDSKDLRQRFLFAPGKFDYSFEAGKFANGTSNSAAYISATLANLLSKSEDITPRMAVKALMKTAEKPDSEPEYGGGLIRADKAAEFLDRFL
ncbi:MAG TPA: S8/S53 family peptidase [Alphaproteobacteria bacterium]|nr:S8/S53 family peptidase [Alphaproteobacteria bacterium]